MSFKLGTCTMEKESLNINSMVSEQWLVTVIILIQGLIMKWITAESLKREYWQHWLTFSLFRWEESSWISSWGKHLKTGASGTFGMTQKLHPDLCPNAGWGGGCYRLERCDYISTSVLSYYLFTVTYHVTSTYYLHTFFPLRISHGHL